MERRQRAVDRSGAGSAGTTSLGPTPGTSTSRSGALPRRAPQTHLHRPAAQQALALHGRHTTCRRLEQITEVSRAVHVGPCWLARTGEVAWVDMLAGRVLATSLARPRRRSSISPALSRQSSGRARSAASSSRPRRASSCSTSTTRRARCARSCKARHPHERRRLRSAGPVLVKSMAYAASKGGRGFHLSGRGRRSFATALLCHDLERLDWSDDGAMRCSGRRHPDRADRHVRVRPCKRRSQSGGRRD